MLQSFTRKYWATIAGGSVIAGIVLLSSLWLGRSTVEDLVSASAKHQAESFSNFLLSDRAILNSFLTTVVRERGLENQIRDVASLSQVVRFAIYDQNGNEAFATSSDQHQWLLRNRPGGLSSTSRLSIPPERAEGGWQIVSHQDGGMPTVLMPLDRADAPRVYLSATFDLSEERAAHAQTLAGAAYSLVQVLLLATGVPALFYIRRKRRMEEADERIWFLHNHDALTNLLNRRRMHEETDRLLATARATRERMAVWYLDVDGLADINDAHGQASGDDVLRIIAGRLAEVVDRNDLLSRTGSDDFAILQRNFVSEECAKSLAHRIAHAASAPIEIGDKIVKPRISLGVALMPEHGRTYAELIKHAELAFLNQKSLRVKEYTTYAPLMDTETHRRRIIEQMLRDALESGGFELFYQPIVSGDGVALLGFEALIRMPDGAGGYVPPSEFIPIAEGRGYIKAIGTWVIKEAARQAAEWPDHLFVSINLSAVQFRDGDLVEIVQSALKANGLDGSRLEIEVVESLLLEQSDEIMDQLRALKDLGIAIDMDDFGTGYSSLGYLWRFPFDKLKIDQSFMLAFSEGKSSVPQILETIISLAHHLGLKVTAEGVETAEQAALLHSFRCDQLQGYYFGKPMPAPRVAGEILKRTYPLPALSPPAGRRATGALATAR